MEEDWKNNEKKELAAAQKQVLHDLYLDKKRPNWMNGSLQVNVVTKSLVEAWRKFIRFIILALFSR